MAENLSFREQRTPSTAPAPEAAQMARRTLYFASFMALTLLTFWAAFRNLAILSFRYDFYSHIVLVPFASAGLIYLNRKKMFSDVRFSFGTGAGLFVAGLVCYGLGQAHRLLSTEGNGFSLTIFSVILLWWVGFVFFYGRTTFRAAAFPLLFLLLMIPIPVFWLDKLIYVLQKGSAEVTYALLRLVNVPIFRQGFIFSLPGVNIEVAKECSGIHSSLALFLTSLVAGYLFLGPGWRRLLLTLSFLPIVIFTNSVRITSLSLLSVYVDRSFLSGNLHRNGGVLFFLLALALMMSVLQLLRGSERNKSQTGSELKTVIDVYSLPRCQNLRSQSTNSFIAIEEEAQMEASRPGSAATYWEKVALTRWGRYLTGIEKRTVLEASRLAGRRKTALEVGCEGGRWACLLAECGWNVICTDTRDEVLEICQRRVPAARCIRVCRTDTTLPCETQTVDLLLCIEVDEVMSSHWIIDETARVLTPGGIFVGTVLNRSSYRAMLHRLLVPLDSTLRKEYGIYQASYEELRKKLWQNGFRLIREEGCCWFPFRRDGNSALVPPLVRLEVSLGLRRIARLSPWVVFVAQKIPFPE